MSKKEDKYWAIFHSVLTVLEA